jgi:hypothetical protein
LYVIEWRKLKTDERITLTVPTVCLKDTFQPGEWEEVPLKPEIYRQLVRCAACDFSTKVRVNLIKHLKLHLVKSKLGKWEKYVI